ncbi:MAG: hypothetical protein HKP27_02230, partial [Myxococcales bacterium]|nr:hypothetical protein [Myxococcales bacterium]
MSGWRSRLLAGLILASAGSAHAYPLDGASDTGIQRLEAARLTQAGELPGRRLPIGALWQTSQVRLRLADRTDFTRPPADPAVSRSLRQMLGAEASRYGIAVLDVSDPEDPLYAEHRGDAVFNPGSVGKLIVALGVFQALADLYPDDVDARRRVLSETTVVADDFILAPSHEVPFWSPGSARVVRRKIRVGDEANLWSFLDWTLSASSNSAASTVIQQLLLLRHFGLHYPA